MAMVPVTKRAFNINNEVPQVIIRCLIKFLENLISCKQIELNNDIVEEAKNMLRGLRPDLVLTS